MENTPNVNEPLPAVENLLDAVRRTERELGYPLDVMAELYYEFTAEPPALTQHHDEQ